MFVECCCSLCVVVGVFVAVRRLAFLCCFGLCLLFVDACCLLIVIACV